MLKMRLGFLFFVVGLFSGCDYEVDVGGDAGQPAPLVNQSDLKLGETCECGIGTGAAECCLAGLFCGYRGQTCENNNYRAAFSCMKKKKQGESCRDSRECEHPQASCTSSGCYVSPDVLDSQRCSESADCSSDDGIKRICQDSYCKRMKGEKCGASSQCASARCYSEPGETFGAPPINYCI